MRKSVLVIFAVLLFLPLAVYAQGCMEASSDEGVSVVGYLQTQYEYLFTEEGEDSQDAFTFNRARMGLVGSIPYDFSYYIMFEFSPNVEGAPFLLDGFITYSRLAPWAKISLGQFKSPFSLELNTPCQGLHTIRRSMVVNELTAYDRDRGIMFNGSYEKLANYAFAFTNGTGRANPENNLNKTFAGRIVISPIDMISFGGGYKFGTSPSSAGLEDEDEQIRYSGEIEFKMDNILVQAEYISAEDKGSYLSGGD